MKINGFQASAVGAALRYKDRFDLGLIVSDTPAAWAGVFTQSMCQAAPVLWSQRVAAQGYGRAFMANAGQANAQTGAEGLADCQHYAGELAKLLKISPDEIMLASTGVIGQRINMPPLDANLSKLVEELNSEGLSDFSQAILTTDTFTKTAAQEYGDESGRISIWGCAKGSGMIAPNMATMLAFVLTDARIRPELLREILAQGADLSFNRVTVDGDTSTNDSLLIMASGTSAAPPIESGPQLAEFKAMVFTVMKNLARQVAKDGEGATKLVCVQVKGAATEAEARLAARTVAESPLVKTAFFGCDANWGRVCMALGRSGAIFDPYAVDIDLDEVPWIRSGVDNGQEELASAVMKKDEYVLSIDLKAGSEEYEMLTCDFSHDYVTINGSYRS